MWLLKSNYSTKTARAQISGVLLVFFNIQRYRQRYMVAEDKGHIICLSCLNCARNYSFAISKIFFKPAKSRSLS